MLPDLNEGSKKCQNIYFWKNQYFSHLALKMNKWRFFYHWKKLDWIFVKSNIKESYNHNLIGEKIQYRYTQIFKMTLNWDHNFRKIYKKAVWHHPWRRPKGSENLNPIFSVLMDHNQPKKSNYFQIMLPDLNEGSKKCQNIYFWKNQYFSHLALEMNK